MGKFPWGAEPRTELGPVLQEADVLPTAEPRSKYLAAPTELRRTQTHTGAVHTHPNIPHPPHANTESYADDLDAFQGRKPLPCSQYLRRVQPSLLAAMQTPPELETYEVDLESYTCVKNEFKLFSCV